MSTRVYEAIVSRWDEQELDDSFAGGIYFGAAPADIEDFPYVVMLSLGNVPDQWTSTSEYRRQGVQMSIFYREEEDLDPVSTLGGLMRTLDSAIRFAPLSIPSSAGHVFDVRPQRDDIKKDSTKGIWHGILEYDVSRRLSVNYNPS